MDVILYVKSKLLTIAKDKSVIRATVLNVLLDAWTVHQLSIVLFATFFILLMSLRAFKTALQLIIVAVVE